MSVEVVLVRSDESTETMDAVKALQSALETLCGYTGEGTGAVAPLAVGTAHLEKYAYPVTALTLAGNPLSDYTVIQDTGSAFRDTADALVDVIESMTGVRLPMQSKTADLKSAHSIRVGSGSGAGGEYQYTLSATDGNFSIVSSKDATAGAVGNFLSRYLPEGTSGKVDIAAPDVEEHDGKFYMLCSVDEHLGLAVADSPLGPFVPQEGFLFEQTIDGHILFDGDDMYIYYVSWRSGHDYGIWGCRMKNDHITPDLSTEKRLICPTEAYESHMAAVTEGPYILLRDGVYSLTYSGCHYESPHYCVCYATSSSPLGGFVKYKGNPIMIGDGETVSGSGHHCFVTAPDGKELLIVYHTHYAPGTVHPRAISIGNARFVKHGTETVLICDPPSVG